MSIGTGSYAKPKILAQQLFWKSIFFPLKKYPTTHLLYQLGYTLFGTANEYGSSWV